MIFIFLSKKKFKNLFFKLRCPRQCHVPKVAQSATATWHTTCQISWDVRPGTFFKYLLRKSKLAQITGTKIIFKPSYINKMSSFYHCVLLISVLYRYVGIVDNINCQCNVDHTKESNTNAIRIT